MRTEGHPLDMASHGRRWCAHCLCAPRGPRRVAQDTWVFYTCCSNWCTQEDLEAWNRPACPLCAPGWPKWDTQLDSLPWPQHLFPEKQGLTCQRLRARRNLSCLVLIKWASSAGMDFCNGRGVGVTRDPGARVGCYGDAGPEGQR